MNSHIHKMLMAQTMQQVKQQPVTSLYQNSSLSRRYTKAAACHVAIPATSIAGHQLLDQDDTR
jgi:hypothetical protein